MASKEDWKFIAIILFVILAGVFAVNRGCLGEGDPPPPNVEMPYDSRG